PLFLGVVVFHRNLEQTAAALELPSVGWGTRGRILAQGEAESLQALVLGGAASALLLAAIAVGLLEKNPSAAPAGLRGKILTMGLVGLVGAVVLVLLGARRLAWEGMLWHSHAREGWPLLASMLLFLGTLGVALYLTRRWPDEEGRGAFLDRCSTAALFLGIAGFLAVWSGAIHVHLSSLEWLYAELPYSLWEKIEKFTTLGAGSTALVLGSPFFVILQLLPLLVVIWEVKRGVQEVKWEDASATLRAAASALLSLGLLVAWLYARHNDHHRLPHVEGDERLHADAFQLTGTQTFASEVLRTARKPRGVAFLVDRQGKLWGSPASRHKMHLFEDALFREIARGSQDADAPAEPILAVDSEMKFAGLEAALGPLRERRQTSFRWLVGVEMSERQHTLLRGLGRYEDIAGWMYLRAPILVEWLPKIEVSEGSQEKHRRVLAVKPEMSGTIATRWMTGGFGVYQRRKDASVTLFRRLVPNPWGKPGSEGEFSTQLAFAVSQAEEILMLVPPEMSARELSELMLELRWYSETLAPRLSSPGAGVNSLRDTPIVFSLTRAVELP
ncbi:MAG: hypothetical protein RMJ98_15770, partial [Myxococcales bacterium]|nr:hypothetical protein [Polyangiaceae bacterium]MDW8250754.1 hypothetical protein [Myxococcales bacterium]